MRRCGKVGSRLARRDPIKLVQTRAAAAGGGPLSELPKPFVAERGDGFVERGLNAVGRAFYKHIVPFNFAQHAENKTTWDLDHISSGNEASITANHQAAVHDKLCKWFTVEGLPGAGKARFTDGFSAGTGTKNMGTGDLWWEHRRLNEFKGQPGLHKVWAELIESKNHYLAMRDVGVDQFFADPKNQIHSCRMQDHMKLQRHIHSMDSLFHLLTTAQGVVTNRTYHSDYCWAYAMMKSGYMSKNFYEMRYCVSQATADGSGTATDLTPNVSFYLDISPEAAFDSIQARGNEAEINTVTLDFLKHLQEAYMGFWAEDMNNKGCTVINIDPTVQTPEDVVDLVDELDENELRHPYSRWAHIHEKQHPNNNVSTWFGPLHAAVDFEMKLTEHRMNRSRLPFTKAFYMGGNHYEKCLQRDLMKGPRYSYDVLYTFHPWDDLSESHSYKDNIKFLNNSDETEWMDDTEKLPHEYMRLECKPIAYHPDWVPPSADWFNTGHSTPYSTILFGSYKKYIGGEFNQDRQHYSL